MSHFQSDEEMFPYFKELCVSSKITGQELHDQVHVNLTTELIFSELAYMAGQNVTPPQSN